MAETTTLGRYSRQLDALDRARVIETGQAPTDVTEQVTRDGGAEISLAALRSLRTAFEDRKESWAAPEKSDQWLAPRLHSALRLTRAQAADKGLWHWVAVAFWPEYVTWRWGKSGAVADNRWFGPVNKQAFARLWWGGELFRDGPDYSVAELAFRNQDLVNSLLHRPVVRCRSLAIGIVKALWECAEAESGPDSDSINDLARVLNLSTAGSPPEAWVGFRNDDFRAALAWASTDAAAQEHDWTQPLVGPEGRDTDEGSQALGAKLAHRGIELAGSSQQ